MLRAVAAAVPLLLLNPINIYGRILNNSQHPMKMIRFDDT